MAQSVALIVKAYAARLGLDPSAFSGHSLRSGFLTSAAARGASLFKMMDVSRHRSVDTLRGYVRDADAFRDHAGAGSLECLLLLSRRTKRPSAAPSPAMNSRHRIRHTVRCIVGSLSRKGLSGP
jgi:hypothetical protein